MPPKKQVQLQVTLQNQDEWDHFMNEQGLLVIDVYSKWCGPCKAVTGLFRRIKNELGDDLLKFAIAETDDINTLELYRGKSEPCFLFYATGGILVAVIRGANGPGIEKTIKLQLEHEHKAINGDVERIAIEDTGLQSADLIEDEEVAEPVDTEEPIVPKKKQFTVAVIKPDAVKAGQVDEIIGKLKDSGLEVLHQEERVLTKEEAAEFYKQHEGSDHFEELIEFMSSGPCMTVVLSKGDTGEGVIDEFRELIGPADVDMAKQDAPSSLRAQYGTNARMNAVHGSDSSDSAARELAFFLPKFVVPWVPGTEPPIQRTLAIIRPGALQGHKEEIVEKISQAGFQIAFQKELQLSKEQAEEFYKEHEGKDYYDSLTSHMASGPVMALALAREDAVQGWRDLLGPKELEVAKAECPDSLRAQFGMEDIPFNQLHGSSSVEDATKEVEYFFPTEHTLGVIKPNALSEKDNIMEKIKEAGFNISLSTETCLTKEMAEQFYSEHKEKGFFDELTDFMCSGPSLFMVLSRPDAVSGWRALMGPTDPSNAKEEQPDSLRALFGADLTKNAVHGSSDAEKAKDAIKIIFGDVQLDAMLPSKTPSAADDSNPATNADCDNVTTTTAEDGGTTTDATTEDTAAQPTNET